jgi:hypothetical protein
MTSNTEKKQNFSYKYIKVVISFLISVITIPNVLSQIAPGQWRDHLPYHQAQKVVLAGDRVYCMTANSLFYYNKTENTINTISKVQGLNETDFSTIAYSPKYDMLVIAYANSNIDIVQKKQIVNIPYIKNKQGISDKTINKILIVDKYAYLACNYGISVLDLEKLLIVDTYYPSTSGESNKVSDICIDSTNLYAATKNGIFKADRSDPFLVNYSKWSKIYNKEFNMIQWVNSYLFGTYHHASGSITDTIMYSKGDNSWNRLNIDIDWALSLDVSNNTLLVSALWNVYAVDKNLNITMAGPAQTPKQAVMDSDGTLWTAAFDQGLIKKTKNGGNEIITPNSPYYPDVVKMDCKDGVLWTAGGAKDEKWTPRGRNPGVSKYSNNSWSTFASFNTEFLAYMADMVNVKIDPLNSQRAFITTWTNHNVYGLIEYNNGNFTLYNETNSTLDRVIFGTYTPFYSYGLDFDADNNLWVTNTNLKKPLCVMTNTGKWYSFSLGDANKDYIGDVVATSWGSKWMFSAMSNRITVFDDNGTIDKTSDDNVEIFSLSGVKQTLNSTTIYCMVEDKDQTIWVGTDAGPVVFYYPQDVFNDANSKIGEKILVPLSKNSTYAAYLLETERINTIAIDGNNRKWFGTQNSGVYLISSDGKTQVAHFTAENSPLLSNTINDIAIDGKSGEVYFGTDKGLISYRGNATAGGTEFGKVYVFPNPVRENYYGNVYVTGLLENCNVKITDISGNLVFETNALGGQAEWNGKNLQNQRVSTGVYLVFCSNKDGSKTYVTKLLFIH